MVLDTVTRIRVLRKQVAILEDDPKNTIGGSKAFFSGKQTFLKPAIVAKIAKLNAKIEILQDTLEEL